MKPDLRLAIRSDGSRKGTIVTDQDGRQIEGLVKVEWVFDMRDSQVAVVIYLNHIHVDYQQQENEIDENDLL